MWTKHDKAKISTGNVIRDGSGMHACPVCWNINRGYENGHRFERYTTQCPVCKVELEWKENNE